MAERIHLIAVVGNASLSWTREDTTDDVVSISMNHKGPRACVFTLLDSVTEAPGRAFTFNAGDVRTINMAISQRFKFTRTIRVGPTGNLVADQMLLPKYRFEEVG